MGKLPFAFTSGALDSDTAALGLDRTADTADRRALALDALGVSCIMALGCSRYRALSPHLPEHIHPGCIEINFCQSGSLLLEKNGIMHELKPGNVFITKPDDRHRLMGNVKGLFMYWLIVRLPDRSSGRRLLDLPERESAALARQLERLPNTTFAAGKRTAEYFRRMFRVYDRSRRTPMGIVRLRKLALDVLLDLVDHGRSPVTVNHFVRIDPAIKAMRANPERDYRVSKLAETAALGKVRFTQLFKQATGFPPHAYLAKCRLEKARRMLLSTCRPLSEIAESLSFSSPRHFSTAFRETFGIRPSSLRKKTEGNSGVCPH